MKTIKILLSGLFLIVSLTNCSSSDEDEVSVIDDGRKMRQLTITQVDETVSRSETDPTRATISETFETSWSKGDELTCCNISNLSSDLSTEELKKSVLEAESSSKTSKFKGPAYCGDDNYFVLSYPSPDSYNFGSISGTVTANYTISLDGQDGTLNTLANSFYYQSGVAKVVSTTETTADANMSSMRCLISFFKLSFVDENNNAIIVDDLKISYVSGKTPHKATVTSYMSNEGVKVEVYPINENTNIPLSILVNQNSAAPIYVAMFHTYGIPFNYSFVVTGKDGNTYSANYSVALNEGKYRTGTLKLTKQ
ncbi:MAG: hypothetical protein IKX25_08305 [Bacteroidales bacterium]|nr:hypothetical protein [Bacteroidales bacterium]